MTKSPEHFYRTLTELDQRIGGTRTLKDCHGRLSWPDRGVYFFFEDSQVRSTSGEGARVVRVGTHAVSRGSRTKLWQRLATHRGSHRTGAGNHRGSIFRLLVGSALIARDQLGGCPQWARGQSAPPSIRETEFAVEKAVSEYLGRMHVLWLEVGDEASPQSLRSYIERNSIALLSSLDPPTGDWLGLSCPSEKVRRSGLWNQDHVDSVCDPSFLDIFTTLVSQRR